MWKFKIVRLIRQVILVSQDLKQGPCILNETPTLNQASLLEHTFFHPKTQFIIPAPTFLFFLMHNLYNIMHLFLDIQKR